MVSAVNLRINLKRMASEAMERGDGPIAAILDVAVRTLDDRIAHDEAAPGLAQTIQTDGIRRSVRIHGRRTTIKLEREFWDALDQISAHWHSTIDALCSDISSMCGDGNLSSAIRVFALRTIASGDFDPR
jgi:predicted DNA-binding ribbon-helix-helix protein